MFYLEKTLDTFEPAFMQMLGFYGMRPLPWTDCAALRCFSFSFGREVRRWFRPAVSVPAAVSALSAAAGVPFSSSAVYAESMEPIFEFPGCLIGPLKQGIAVPDLTQTFYQGEGRYLAVRNLPGKEAEVYDPLGLPGLVLDRPFLEKLIPAHGVYCIFPENSGTGKRLHPADLLHAGLGYRRRRRREEQEEMREAFASYQPGRANGLSLFWGTMNLAQKLDQVLKLKETAGAADPEIERAYLQARQRLSRAARQENLREIREAFCGIWEILDEQ